MSSISQSQFDPGFYVFVKLSLPAGFFLLSFFFINLFLIKKNKKSLSFLNLKPLIPLILVYLLSVFYYVVASDALIIKEDVYLFSFKFKFFSLIFLLFGWFIFGIYECGGLIKLCDFFEDRLNGHLKEAFGPNTFASIWYMFRGALTEKTFFKTSTGRTDFNYFIFAWCIVFVLATKELIKKILYLFIVSIFYQYQFVEAIFYISNYLVTIFLVSLIGIDKDLAGFIEHYFGPYVLGWLGSYQYIGPEGKFISAINLKRTSLVPKALRCQALGKLTIDQDGKIKLHNPALKKESIDSK